MVGLVWLGVALAQDATVAPPAVDVTCPIARSLDSARHVRIDGALGPLHFRLPARSRATSFRAAPRSS